MQINLIKFGEAETLTVEEGTTLADALRDAGVDPDATIRFRGETVSGEATEVVLAPGDTVVAAPPSVDHGRS